MRRASRTMMIRGGAVLIAGAAIFSLVAFVWYGRTASDGETLRPLPEFAFNDYGGAEVRQSDFLDKPVVIMLWASWCPFCSEELEHLSAIQNEFGEAVSIVAINRAESRDTAMRHSIASAIATGTIFVLDPDDAYYRAIGGFAMPEILIADHDGIIRFHKRGLVEREALRRYLQDILAL